MKSKRPLPIRLLPQALRASLYYRFYHARHRKWSRLFDEATLALAPSVSMYGLVPGDLVSGSIAFTGCHEYRLSRAVAELAPIGGLMVDVGANMGYFSLLWASLNARNRVLALEPEPRNLSLLRRNVARNGFRDRIRIVGKAAGDRTAQVSFDTGPREQTGWGGISIAKDSSALTVSMVTLDELLPDQTVDVLKIDVEGADTLVLRGAQRLLAQRRVRRIFFEENRERMARLHVDPAEAKRLLASHGYAVEPFAEQPGEWTAYAR